MWHFADASSLGTQIAETRPRLSSRARLGNHYLMPTPSLVIYRKFRKLIYACSSFWQGWKYSIPIRQAKRRTRMQEMDRARWVFVNLLAHTPGTGDTGYLFLSKVMTLSENDMSEKTEAGGRFFGTAALVLVSVASWVSDGSAVPAGALNWVSVATTTPSCPSSVSRRLSREFMLLYKARDSEYDIRMNKENAHWHECAEIESNHDEEGRRVC